MRREDALGNRRMENAHETRCHFVPSQRGLLNPIAVIAMSYNCRDSL